MTCDTCKHWDTNPCENIGHHRCNHPKVDGYDEFPVDGFGTTDGEPYNQGVFATGPKFGCVHHEPSRYVATPEEEARMHE